jgi:hypothetical protein
MLFLGATQELFCVTGVLRSLPWYAAKKRMPRFVKTVTGMGIVLDPPLLDTTDRI